MIIIRQKQYTRAENKALLELYKLTEGGVKLPGGSSARDMFRFNKFSGDLKNLALGNKKDFDIENAKELAKNIGITDPNIVEKMVNKYTNKRALVRLKNQKNLNNSTLNQEKLNKLADKLSKNSEESLQKNNDLFQKLHDKSITSEEKTAMNKLEVAASKKNIGIDDLPENITNSPGYTPYESAVIFNDSNNIRKNPH